MLLPLHVFEPRYRKLVRDVRARDGVFVVALIRSGEEVGPHAEPHDVGCAASIFGARELPDGRWYLLAQGERRVAIESAVADEEPYLVADTRGLPEREGDDVVSFAAPVRAAFDEYRLAVSSVGTPRYVEGSLQPDPADPVALSYAIASGLAVDAGERQMLLEAATAAERLEAELRLLERENNLLRDLLVRQHARREGPRPN